MRILVLGASGYVGSKIKEVLQEIFHLYCRHIKLFLILLQKNRING